DGDDHADGEGEHVSGLDGQDAGQAADAHRVGGGGSGGADDAGHSRADHAAQEREVILQVDAEHGRVGHAQVAGDAGGDVDFLCGGVLALQVDHAEDGGALGDVGQRDHGPQHGAAEVGHQLQVDGVGHVVQAGDDQRGVHKSEHGAEDDAERARDAGVHGGRNRGAHGPADGAEHEVGGHDRQHQAAEGHHDHRDDGRADLTEEALQVHQGEGGQHGGDDLRLVADHVDLDEAEVPLGDVGGGGGGHRISVQQLA